MEVVRKRSPKWDLIVLPATTRWPPALLLDPRSCARVLVESMLEDKVLDARCQVPLPRLLHYMEGFLDVPCQSADFRALGREIHRLVVRGRVVVTGSGDARSYDFTGAAADYGLGVDSEVVEAGGATMVIEAEAVKRLTPPTSPKAAKARPITASPKAAKAKRPTALSATFLPCATKAKPVLARNFTPRSPLWVQLTQEAPEVVAFVEWMQKMGFVHSGVVFEQTCLDVVFSYSTIHGLNGADLLRSMASRVPRVKDFSGATAFDVRALV